MELFGDVVEEYADFADYAAVDSPCFESWARSVASDPSILDWLASLPPIKRQPNLVFAAARWHDVPAPGPYQGLRDALLGDDGSIRATIMARFTQTNEAGRLAVLAPAFASIADGPLSLLEVGASAGLCLYPDRHRYVWSTPDGEVSLGDGPTLTCAVTGPAPLPSSVVDVAWRGGIDLTPIDVTDSDATAWLENLVWPEQEERRTRLRAALAIARREPPVLVKGDLLEELPALIEIAAAHGPVVVFHTAVISYLEPPARARFHELMTDLVASGACHWVSNEGPRVLPSITGSLHVPPGRMVMAIDGEPVAFTHGHGAAVGWLFRGSP